MSNYQNFIDFANYHGLAVNSVHANCGKVRVPIVDGKRGNKDGEYKLFDDALGIGGYVKNYKTHTFEKYFENANLDDLVIRKLFVNKKENTDRIKTNLHNTNAKKAEYLCKNVFKKAINHQYLIKKKIDAHNTLVDKHNDLIIPLTNINKNIRTFAKVFADGTKAYMANAQKRGCFHQFGFINDKVVICEGFATGASIYESTGIATISAMDSSNLEPVAVDVRKKYGIKLEIIIAGDDDHAHKYNSGKISAINAAKAIVGKPLFPIFSKKQKMLGFTDFNDLKNDGIDIKDIILNSFSLKGS